MSYLKDIELKYLELVQPKSSQSIVFPTSRNARVQVLDVRRVGPDLHWKVAVVFGGEPLEEHEGDGTR